MRRKVVQDFANVCCQMFLTSMSNYDRINFVLFGSGTVVIDFLNQRCTHNELAVSPLHYCNHFSAWLKTQCEIHHIDFDSFETAELTATLDIQTSRRDRKYINWLTCSMDIECSSIVVADSFEYRSSAQDSQMRGLGQIIQGRTY